MITFPTDLASFLSLIKNPIVAGLMLTWFLTYVPFFINPKNANWLKFTVAIVICLLWAFGVTLLGSGLPTTATSVYGVIDLGLSVAFTNQAFYRLIDNLPAIKNFLLALFGKPTSTQTTNIKLSAETQSSTTPPAAPPTTPPLSTATLS